MTPEQELRERARKGASHRQTAQTSSRSPASSRAARRGEPAPAPQPRSPTKPARAEQRACLRRGGERHRCRKRRARLQQFLSTGCAARQGSGGARGVRRREAARAAWRARGGTARARRQVGSPAAAESHRGRLWSTESIRAPGSSIVSWSGRAGRVRGCHREPSWAQWGLRAPTSHRRPAAAGGTRERRRVGEAGKSARTPLASTLRWT